MNYEDRQFIIAQLSQGQKADSIAHALVMRRALEEVEEVAKDVAATEARAKWMQEQQYYVLLGPKPEPEKVGDEDGMELWQQPGRQEYKVKVMNFAAFCKEMKLPIARMEELVLGQHRDVQGFSCIWTGGSMDQGRPWVDPEPRRRVEETQRALIAKEPRKRMSVYTPTPPVIEWKPEADAPSTGPSK